MHYLYYLYFQQVMHATKQEDTTHQLQQDQSQLLLRLLLHRVNTFIWICKRFSFYISQFFKPYFSLGSVVVPQPINVSKMGSMQSPFWTRSLLDLCLILFHISQFFKLYFSSGSVVVPQPINVSKMGSMQSAAAAHGLGHPLHPQVTSLPYT